ncbi:putative late blight resistance protein homolog R1A-10 [Salvia miltiorrhiza]|uniref:putative late blight resistance protein homolog R1A-10 n=1 Tax=Salvia miltiorrhiza TaxID=226208 RepID=UPI0025AC9FC9|nr:putative late blight resistance protein homolog R1A-10 [Salvia miltiorrhiza]
MAYAALISLKHTINRLLYSSAISIVSPGLGMIRSAYRELRFLEGVVKRLDSRSSIGRENGGDDEEDVERRIREAVFKLEDALEFYASDQFESRGDEGCPLMLSLDSEAVHLEMESFTEMVKIVKNYSEEFVSHEEDEYAAAASEVVKSEMVGLADELRRIRSSLTTWMTDQLCVASLEGMAGVGKTTLAKEAFDDPFVCQYFDIRVWISVGEKYQLKRIILSILAQIDLCIDRDVREGDEELIECLNESLKGRRYLIVLDDVWDLEIRDFVNKVLPEESNGSRVLLTTRLHEVSRSLSYVTSIHRVRFLNKEESWSLLRHKVFGDEWCPPPLERVGRRIAAICEGLPLAVVMVADILSRGEKTVKYWNEVAERKNSVFTDAYGEMYELLYPSYKQLPHHLKVYFLYMGVFPENHHILISKLFQLWVAEGFISISQAKINQILTVEWLEELVSRSIIIIPQRGSSYKFKTCKLHSAFWHLCVRESEKAKFLHIINTYSHGFTEGIEDQRRLCIHNGILFGIKEVHDSMASASASRSLLCTGPPHPYPVPVCFELRLLRVLDALAIRFYEFPIEALRLVHLRYLALTCNGDLPASISLLRSICFLIVRRHLSLKSPGEPPYLPEEIWDMQELVHLQIMGGNLPNPNGAVLENLLTLSDVSSQSCTKEVLEGVPRLRKLGIQIELEPDADAADPFSCFDHISHLYSLNSLKCVVVNPELSYEIPTPSPLPSFPKRLKKLSLSGCGYPWECLREIALMPNLEVLKLRCYAFQGPEWEVRRGEFLKLKFLLLEDSDLVRWRAEDPCFPCLDRVILRHCYGLEEVPWRRLTSVQEVELVDCYPSALKQMPDYQMQLGNVGVHSSWEELPRS